VGRKSHHFSLSFEGQKKQKKQLCVGSFLFLSSLFQKKKRLAWCLVNAFLAIIINSASQIISSQE
jgi:hypothetical protein|tara:strand:+ start:312 stop:506 length:195 start_codon:yes stop_codon:yes gene_type:complete